MAHCKKQTSPQTNKDDFSKKTMKQNINAIDKQAFNEVTKVFASAPTLGNSGKRGYGACAITNNINKK